VDALARAPARYFPLRPDSGFSGFGSPGSAVFPAFGLFGSARAAGSDFAGVVGLGFPGLLRSCRGRRGRSQ